LGRRALVLLCQLRAPSQSPSSLRPEPEHGFARIVKIAFRIWCAAR
jgi:hypothetical protein